MKANEKASPLIKTDFFKSLGWRVLVGFVLLYLAVWLASLFLGVGPNMLLRALSVPEQIRLVISGTISRGGMIVVTVLFSIWMFQRVTRLDADEYFYPICSGWWQDLLAGLGLGLFAMLSIFVIEMGLGWLRLEGWARCKGGDGEERWAQSGWCSWSTDLLPLGKRPCSAATS